MTTKMVSNQTFTCGNYLLISMFALTSTAHQPPAAHYYFSLITALEIIFERNEKIFTV